MDLHVGCLDQEKNDTETTLEMFRWFARVVKRQFPKFLHVVVTDSPKIHCSFPEDYAPQAR